MEILILNVNFSFEVLVIYHLFLTQSTPVKKAVGVSHASENMRFKE